MGKPHIMTEINNLCIYLRISSHDMHEDMNKIRRNHGGYLTPSQVASKLYRKYLRRAEENQKT